MRATYNERMKKLAPLPKTFGVQLAMLAKRPPDGDQWLHELKFDGYRMICRIEGGKARFMSRNGKDWTMKFGSVARAASGLRVRNAIFDGELVAIQPDGRTSFQALQNSFESGARAKLIYYVFDLLFLNGKATDRLPIEERKLLLKRTIAKADKCIQLSEHVIGDGPDFFKQAAKMRLEGIVSKRLGQPYRPGRSTDWLKIKTSQRAEFVIGGYTRPDKKSRTGFGALLVGYYERGKLVYAGRVGTGFSERTLSELHARMAKQHAAVAPFPKPSVLLAPLRTAVWIKPTLVAEVAFSEWTADNQLRHPSFQGLREDKSPTEVKRDKAVYP